MRYWIPVLFVLFLIPYSLFPIRVASYTSPGSPKGFMNDFAGMLKPEEVQSLEADLQNFSNQTGNEIAVVTVPNLGGDTIENYAVKLFEEWKIGKAKQDNGVLFLISRDDRQVRIEVGYGLEPVITDIESAHIIADEIVPNFKLEHYYGGISGALARLEGDITRGAPLNNPQTSQDHTTEYLNYVFYFMAFILIIGQALGSTKSWWLGGVLGGATAAIIWFFTWSLKIGLIAFIILVPLGLLIDKFLSKYGGKGGPKPPWFIGGGRFGGGGGGFGGFGGGSSGGGGASGRW